MPNSGLHMACQAQPALLLATIIPEGRKNLSPPPPVQQNKAMRLFPDRAARSIKDSQYGLIFITWPRGRAKLLHDHTILQKTGLAQGRNSGDSQTTNRTPVIVLIICPRAGSGGQGKHLDKRRASEHQGSSSDKCGQPPSEERDSPQGHLGWWLC